MKSFMDKVITQVNRVLIVSAAMVLIACYFDTQDNLTISMDRIEPSSEALLADGSKEYFFNLSNYDYHKTGLMFLTSHQTVKAYSQGKEIYSFTKPGGFWTSSVGSKYNFVDINDNMHFVTVVLKPVYNVVSDQPTEFYIGSPNSMYNSILLESMPRFFISLLIVIMSLIILIYYAFMHKRQKLSKELLYLGSFTNFCGIWSINETNFANLIFQNKILNSLIPYYCLMLLVPPFIMFFDSYLNIYSKVIKRLIICASMLQFIVLTALHFLKIAEYRETLVFVQAMICIAVLYLIVGMITQIAKHRMTQHIEICAVGLGVFMISVVVDIKQYYKGPGDADRIGRYIFFFFVAILAKDMINEANEIIAKGKQVKQLEVFALTDSMTGLLNRNAFERQARSENNLDGLIAVVADANGLKQCNDTYGHEAGDEYITIVAKIFNDVYGKYGNCYRIGGDEFCCIISYKHSVNLERLKSIFLTKIYTENVNGNYAYDISVAIGDACYDPSKDFNFRSLVKRADADMYENKRTVKLS